DRPIKLAAYAEELSIIGRELQVLGVGGDRFYERLDAPPIRSIDRGSLLLSGGPPEAGHHHGVRRLGNKRTHTENNETTDDGPRQAHALSLEPNLKPELAVLGIVERTECRRADVRLHVGRQERAQRVVGAHPNPRPVLEDLEPA